MNDERWMVNSGQADLMDEEVLTVARLIADSRRH